VDIGSTWTKAAPVELPTGRLDDAAPAAVRAAEPDVVLLVGGTDGGEASVLRANAAALAGADSSVPVVLAGNAAIGDEPAAVLRAGGVPVSEAGNVRPDIDRLSTDPRLRQRERAVTPDAVLEGMTVLTRTLTGGGAPQWSPPPRPAPAAREPGRGRPRARRVGADAGGAGSVLDATPVIVDRRSVLAAIGLLAAEHPEAAAGLAEELLRSAGTVTPSGR
jgi:hypothetical protein